MKGPVLSSSFSVCCGQVFTLLSNWESLFLVVVLLQCVKMSPTPNISPLYTMFAWLRSPTITFLMSKNSKVSWLQLRKGPLVAGLRKGGNCTITLLHKSQCTPKMFVQPCLMLILNYYYYRFFFLSNLIFLFFFKSSNFYIIRRAFLIGRWVES